MPRRVLAILVLVSGCNAIFGIDDPASQADASAEDSAQPGIDAGLCWGTDPRICLQQVPAAPFTITTPTLFDTDGSECVATDSAFCAIAGTDVSIAAGATLQVTGSKPLVIIAFGTLAITGTLDVASHANPRTSGPGATTAPCNGFAGVPSSRGGGAGGSFGGAGGAGAGAINPTTGNGGTPGPAITSPMFRAGCAGQDSGQPGTLTGRGGFGGGAVYLIAGSTIDVDGAVDASGAGGFGGECRGDCVNSLGSASGGGGGGSGGMILLEAPAIAITGRVFADGGGGGEGSSRSSNGLIGGESTGAGAPLGGDNANADFNGGGGGAGTHATIAQGGIAAPGDDPGGGGGGGGGAGVIRARGTVSGGGVVSPAP